jgi:pSer/pThr/pTyr-binding forkhead associated (FHA) protein
VYEKIRHLPDVPVRQKASGVELKGKLKKLDLYSVVWRQDETAGPAPPGPSKEQLSIATGLHTGLAEMLQYRSAREPVHLDKTAVLGTQETTDLPEVGVRFEIVRVRSDGSLGKRYLLGRPGMIAGQEGEIILDDDPLVAPQHVRFTQIGEGVYIEDLGSLQGAFLRLREPHRLKDGDLIQIGRQKLRFINHATESSVRVNASLDRTLVLDRSATLATQLACLIRLNSKDEETGRYELHRPETSFGRSKGTHTFPEDPYLSAIHACVRLHDGQYFMEDLGSTNGTFVRIRKRALTRDGDTVMIGKHLLRILRAQPHTIERNFTRC